MIEQAENSCLARCKGECCKNLVLSATADELTRLSKAPVLLHSLEEVLTVIYHSYYAKGAYYAPYKGTYAVGIKGKCPNLQSDGECGIYAERPDACGDFTVGGRECKIARKRANLKPL